MPSSQKTTPLTDPEAARAALEELRWPEGPVCPHCKAKGPDIVALNGTKHRAGLYSCRQCRKQFTVTIGTVMEGSRLTIDQWWKAAFVLSDYNEDVGADEVQAATGATYKSALRLKRLMQDVWLAQEQHKRTFGKATSDLSLKRSPPPKTERARFGLWRRRRDARNARVLAGGPPVQLRPVHIDRMHRTTFLMTAIVLQDPAAPELKKQRSKSQLELRAAKLKRAAPKKRTSLTGRTTTAV